MTLNGVRSRDWEGVGKAEALLQRKGRWSELHEMLGEADIVVLTTAQTAKTRGMVNASFLAACRPGVHIINVARGTYFGNSILVAIGHRHVSLLGTYTSLHSQLLLEANEPCMKAA